MAGPIHAVGQQNVLPAVGVVIQKGAPRAQSLGEQLAAISSAVVLEVNSCRAGYVGKMKPQRRLRRTPEHWRAQSRRSRQGRRSNHESPAVHGMFTKPLRMAYTTNSAVL